MFIESLPKNAPDHLPICHVVALVMFVAGPRQILARIWSYAPKELIEYVNSITPKERLGPSQRNKPDLTNISIFVIFVT